MKFMMLVKSNAQIETGALPDLKLFEEMGRYNEELAKAKVLISLDGLHPSSDGARVFFKDGAVSVIDGPFANPDDLVAGYWVIQVGSKEEAVEWAKRVPFKDGVVEIRQIQEVSDFPPEIQSAIAGESDLKV